MLEESTAEISRGIPRALYTWTTEEQVALLRTERRLLVRTESPVYGQTLFAQTIAARASSDDPVAALLSEPRFARHRYCWTQAWATARGCAGEAYGDRLLRVQLRPEAIMAVFSPEAPDIAHDAPDAPSPWRFLLSDGREIPTPEALAVPDRIGVVLHTAATWRAGTFATPFPAYRDNHWADSTFNEATTLSFREYVLVNEAMIAAFEVDTDAVRAELERSRQTATALAALSPLPPALARSYKENLALFCAEYHPEALPEVTQRLTAAIALLSTPLRHEYGPLDPTSPVTPKR